MHFPHLKKRWFTFQAQISFRVNTNNNLWLFSLISLSQNEMRMVIFDLIVMI